MANHVEVADRLAGLYWQLVATRTCRNRRWTARSTGSGRGHAGRGNHLAPQPCGRCWTTTELDHPQSASGRLLSGHRGYLNLRVVDHDLILVEGVRQHHFFRKTRIASRPDHPDSGVRSQRLTVGRDTCRSAPIASPASPSADASTMRALQHAKGRRVRADPLLKHRPVPAPQRRHSNGKWHGQRDTTARLTMHGISASLH